MLQRPTAKNDAFGAVGQPETSACKLLSGISLTSKDTIMQKPHRILVIVTSHAELGTTGRKTGFWLEELATPYAAFVSAGVDVDIASPLGGRPPVDPGSERDPSPAVRRFLEDQEAVAKLEHTLKVESVSRDYDAYFVAGGHGTMWDLATDPVVARLLGESADAGKIVAAVCHGPAALVAARHADGIPIVLGRTVAAFSNEEERAVGLTEVVPFLLETRLSELGAKYERGPLWASFAVRDGTLITGQNPASSLAVAQLTLEALAER